MLHRLCISIWETCHWPEDWKIQEFVVLFKSGDPKLCSNYRTIALISHTSKILLMIIVDHLKRKLESEQPEEQAAYRKERGTRDMLVCLQVLDREGNSHEPASFHHVHRLLQSIRLSLPTANFLMHSWRWDFQNILLHCYNHST